jgi:hypothetical protein
VKGEFSFADDELKEGGVDQLTGTFEMMVQGGKLASLKPTLDTETQQKLAAAFAPPPARELAGLDRIQWQYLDSFRKRPPSALAIP